MRYVRTFEKYEDFLAAQEAVSGSGQYVEDIVPGYVYVKENYPDGEYTFFNGHTEPEPEGYQFGDVIYSDGTGLKSAYWSAYTPSMGEKVGLIVIGSDEAPDGNARMIAFTDVLDEGIANEPMLSISPKEQGDGTRDVVMGAGNDLYPRTFNFYPSNTPDLFSAQTAYDCFNCYWFGKNEAEYTCLGYYNIDYPTLSSDDNYYGGEEMPNPLASNEYVIDSEFVLGPFSGDSLNEYYFTETPASDSTDYTYNALSDFSGYTWSKMMYDQWVDSEGMPYDPYDFWYPTDYTYGAFSAVGTNYGDWYVPAVGEMGFMVSRFGEINEIMNAENIAGSALSYDYYLNSTIMLPFKFANQSKSSIFSQVLWGGGYEPGPSPKAAFPVSERHGYFQYANPSYVPSGYFPGAYVRPFAMIKEGQIVNEAGDLVENGHQVKDLQGGIA